MNRRPTAGQGLRATVFATRGFTQYDGRRIAVVLMCRKRPRMYWGTAQYQKDELLGPVLRIRLARGKSASETDVIISEKEWTGRIEPDTLYGCDFCFIPGQESSGARSKRG